MELPLAPSLEKRGNLNRTPSVPLRSREQGLRVMD